MVERERFVQVSPQETQFEQDHTNSGKRSDNCVFFSWILDLIDNYYHKQAHTQRWGK